MMLLSLLTAALLSQSPADDAPPPRRYALLIGANQGLSADEPLRFADADARRMFTLFRDAGGLLPEDAQVVLGADASRVKAALGTLRARMARDATPGDQLLVYVSSHADGEALHLSGTRLPVKELVSFMEASPVGVAVMFIDSCRSGAATRVKGLEPVEERLVQWATPAIKGRVIVTSSSADEASQEADDLQGSFFTHHLLAGLRGAGDLNRDGRVTLQESYAYAYGRTVESTLLTRAGTQHPNFHFDLKGQGELVLTEPVLAPSRLLITVPEPGEWVVASEQDGMVMGVFSKGSGPVMLALPPGGYRLRSRREASWLELRVAVPEKGHVLVDESLLREGTLVAMQAKGASGWRGALHLGGAFATRTASNFGSSVGGQLQALFNAPIQPGLLDVVWGTVAGRASKSVVSGGLRQTEWSLRLGMGRRFQGQWSALTLGPELGALYFRQREAGTSSTGTAPYGGVSASAWLGVERVSLVVTGSVGGAVMPLPQGNALRALASAGIGLGWNF
ncbi:caspase family protein [Corallococcus macrosporus]|uniref:ICE-like protease n=1 Tax=Myxococcus fulvus (strain ATCC BAA-855 / HW-1) TaxID=483219 RepID=F8C8W9_MYXFH|nr:caspase family protein [Corallococcus macrosporus]AEI64469.1 ICE-like protease [Corallococcus macrosporus]